MHSSFNSLIRFSLIWQLLKLLRFRKRSVQRMKKKRTVMISTILGIYLSLVFYISVNFPSIESNLPLASVDALPQNALSRFLDHVRCALDAGYGIEQTLTALLIAGFVYYALTKLWPTAYTNKISFYLLELLFGLINTAGLCLYWA